MFYTNEIDDLIGSFITDVTEMVEANAKSNIVLKLEKNLAYGRFGDRKLGVSMPKAPRQAAWTLPKAARRKGPIQLCPSPGCKERAAPVFGMLCGKHKGAPKRVVAKWREARRIKAIKQGKKPAKAKAKPSKSVAKKPAKSATKKS